MREVKAWGWSDRGRRKRRTWKEARWGLRRFNLWRSDALFAAAGTAAASRLVWLSAKYYLYSVARAACVRLRLAVPFRIRIISTCCRGARGNPWRAVLAAHSTGPIDAPACTSTCSTPRGGATRVSPISGFCSAMLPGVHPRASVQVTESSGDATERLSTCVCISVCVRGISNDKCVFSVFNTRTSRRSDIFRACLIIWLMMNILLLLSLRDHPSET